MKFTLTMIILTTFLSQTVGTIVQTARLPTVSRRITGNTEFCRMFNGPSRCVDEPLKVMDSEPWCTYRMCGPSFVVADLCPINRDVQATHKCIRQELQDVVYQCDGGSFGHVNVPVGCKIGDMGCKNVPACSCVKVVGFREVLTKIVPFVPDCKP